MKTISFKFYSVLKNEDAIPYIGGNLLVTADGLGGSGSTVHLIDRTKHADIHNEIMSGAFGDIRQISSDLSQYIEELITPMADERDDTSALWASRIVIARCVYALTEGEFKDAILGEEKVRADLAEFIAKGLHNIAETFDLKNGKYDNQLLLPTTLAFIRYTEGEDSVIAETVWAGDSRLYALTPAGLKLLSIDDEDNSGSITNLFYADNQKIHLNYLRHEIQKPCVLMAVSDGVFDPFDPHDHLGVEYTLLSAIIASNSEHELADKLRDFFDSVHGDDATMAFASFGFSDFADIKEAFKGRAEKILTIRQKQAEMYSVLEVMNLSEEDATHYVISRTADRYDYIISILLDTIDKGKDDVAIPEKMRNIVKCAKRAYKTVVETTRKKRRELAFDKLNKYVLSHPELVIPEILTHATLKFQNQYMEETYMGFKQAAGDLVLQLSRFGDAEKRLKESGAKRQILHEQIQAKIAVYLKRFDDAWNNWDPEVSKDRVQVFDILCVWGRIDNSLKFGWVLQDIGKLPSNDMELAYDIRAFNSDCRTLRSIINSCRIAINKIRNSYERLWERLLEYLKRDERLPKILLSPDANHKFGFNESYDDTITLEAEKKKKEDLLKELKARKADIVTCIVNALAVGWDKTSVIDAQYNATKLELFRTYYRLQNNPTNEIKEFEKELLDLEAEYTSLVVNAKL